MTHLEDKVSSDLWSNTYLSPLWHTWKTRWALTSVQTFTSVLYDTPGRQGELWPLIKHLPQSFVTHLEDKVSSDLWSNIYLSPLWHTWKTRWALTSVQTLTSVLCDTPGRQNELWPLFRHLPQSFVTHLEDKVSCDLCSNIFVSPLWHSWKTRWPLTSVQTFTSDFCYTLTGCEISCLWKVVVVLVTGFGVAVVVVWVTVRVDVWVWLRFWCVNVTVVVVLVTVRVIVWVWLRVWCGGWQLWWCGWQYGLLCGYDWGFWCG